MTPSVGCRAFQNGRTLGKQGVPSALMRQLRWRKASWAAPHASPGPDVKAPHASAVVSLQDPNKVHRGAARAACIATGTGSGAPGWCHDSVLSTACSHTTARLNTCSVEVVKQLVMEVYGTAGADPDD